VSLMRTFLMILFVLFALIQSSGDANAQCGTLANPGFEDGPGSLGSFYNVVGPPFSPGFWGAENGAVVDTTAVCSLGGPLPHSGSYMLEMHNTGVFSTHSEVWQVVQFGPVPPGTVSVSAWFTACEGIAPDAILEIRTYSTANAWPTHTLLQNVHLQLDSSAATWEQATLDCVPIPSGTSWLLIHAAVLNADIGNEALFMDDVSLTCDCVIPTEQGTWGAIKSLYGE